MAAETELLEREEEYENTWGGNSIDAMTPYEVFWRDHYWWLESRGYKLRPRYHPDWVPSWKNTKKNIYTCEDSLALPVFRGHLIDATRISDGEVVMIKRVIDNEYSNEVGIATLFSREPLASNPKNHCVPILDTLQVPDYGGMVLLVMPILRPFNRPKIWTYGEAVEFFRQAFEGIQFMHGHHFAHRDCTGKNIMMDSKKCFPNGFHPIRIDLDHKCNRHARHWTRTERPPKYLLIDFGLSRYYNPERGSPLDLPVRGIDKSAPEFQEDKYNQLTDPFATDIYYLGNMIKMEFLDAKYGFEFMVPLITDMTHEDPSQRPPIDKVVDKFDSIYRSLSLSFLRMRIRARDEDESYALIYKWKHFFRSMKFIFMRIPPVPREVLMALHAPRDANGLPI